MKPFSLRHIFSLMFGALLFWTFTITPALAAGYGQIITNWADPAPYSFTSFGNDLHVTGSYTLPPDWIGNLYVFQDGQYLSWLGGTKSSRGGSYITFSNLGAATEKLGTFDINLGIQPTLPDPHKIQIKMLAGAPCTILKTCSLTQDNHADETAVVRDYTAVISPNPIITVSYDPKGDQPITSIAAFNFANTPVGSPDRRTLYVRNVGGGTAVGSFTITGGSDEFSCIGTCTYSIPSNNSAPIQIQYDPQAVGQNNFSLINFSCTPNCNGIGNLRITGNSVASELAPVADIYQSYIDLGTTNVGSYSDLTINVTNRGGGVLNGNISFGDASYTCVPNCNYSVHSSEAQPITVRFTPTTGDNHNTTATFSGGTTPVDWEVLGNGRDKPLIHLDCQDCYSPTQWQIDTPLQPGQVRFQDIDVTNIGTNVLNGHIDPNSWTSDGWECTGVTQNGVTTMFSDNLCNFTNLVNGGPPAIVHMKFTASTGNIGGHFDYITFLEDTDANDSKWLAVGATVTVDPMLEIAGQGSDIWFDTLVNTPMTRDITLHNIGTTPITVMINNIPLADTDADGAFTCVDPTQCGTPLIIAAGDTVTTTFVFTPTSARSYWQQFTICVDASCATYAMHGYASAPHLSVHSVIPGGENMDLMKLCANQGDICTFPGTETVYYGDGIKNFSKSFTDSADCNDATFGDPDHGITKHCWIANNEGGTWINEPGTTRNAFTLENDGSGPTASSRGSIEWRFVDAANFACTNNCTNWLSDIQDQGSDIIFNPTIAGAVLNQSIKIEYDYFVISEGVRSTTDCPGGIQWCHTMTIPLTGTGLGGPRISASIQRFPTTNINTSSKANLTVSNSGTEDDLHVTVNHVSGPFACTANCGPLDIPPGGSFVSEITFSPTVAGAPIGRFSVDSPGTYYTSGVGPTSRNIGFRGFANALPLLGLLPVAGFIDYSRVSEGTQKLSGTALTDKIIVTNNGVGLLTGEASVMDDTHFKCISCHYVNLGPGQTQELVVAFAPKSVGRLATVLNFSNGGGGAITLVGIGEQGVSSVTSDDSSFGRVIVRRGNHKDQMVTIYNNGSAAVPGGDIALTGPFTCVPPTPINPVTGLCTYPNIPANGSVTFTIRFAPTVQGPASGILSLGNSGDATINLTGTGIVPSVKFIEK